LKIDAHQHIWPEPLLDALAATGERSPAAHLDRDGGSVSRTLGELESFVAWLAATTERWQHLVRHASDACLHEQIWDDADVNAWLICWSEEQDTGFHDHDKSGAAIAVISGHVREERLTLGSPPRVRKLGAGSVVNIPPAAIHRVLHAGDQPAVTIHAYSPPLTRTGAYRVGPHGELERQSVSYEAELPAEPALS
jgi:quercetin dioxygenase-like cupin family protein